MTTAVRQRRRGRNRVLTAADLRHMQDVTREELAKREAAATETAVLPQRLPVEPLLRLVEGRGGLYACLGTSIGPRVSRLDRVYRRGRERGDLTWSAADELAVEVLGLHPLEVWGEGWLGA